MAMTVLTILGLILLKLSLNILYPRQWTLMQTLSDAYLTYEKAYAQRIPFDELVAADSPWPAQPQSTTTSGVEIGRTPGGTPVFGTVIRTRVSDPGNYPPEASGTVEVNPAAMRIWKVQSILTFTVGERTYTKARTVIRVQ